LSWDALLSCEELAELRDEKPIMSLNRWLKDLALLSSSLLWREMSGAWYALIKSSRMSMPRE